VIVDKIARLISAQKPNKAQKERLIFAQKPNALVKLVKTEANKVTDGDGTILSQKS